VKTARIAEKKDQIGTVCGSMTVRIKASLNDAFGRHVVEMVTFPEKKRMYVSLSLSHQSPSHLPSFYPPSTAVKYVFLVIGKKESELISRLLAQGEKSKNGE
jgi:hypothetical protein